MRYSFSFPTIIFLCLSVTGYSQSRSQIRLKMGAVKSIVLPGNSEDYAYKMKSSRKMSADIALEYSHLMRNKSTSWFAGVSLDPQSTRISLNRSNFQSFDHDPVLNGEQSTFRFYAGMGKDLKSKGLKNRFNLFGGLGFAVNFESSLSGRGQLTGTEGITKNGEFFKSSYINMTIFPGIKSGVYVSRDFRITPTIFTGIRWQRINRKGNDGLGLELLVNYGLIKYFEYKVPYTLDGIAHEDSFDEKGICVQLNLIIPLKNFGKAR